MDFLLQNGGPKCTLIESFDNHAVVWSDGKKWEFPTLKEAKQFIEASKMEITVDHLHGARRAK